MITMVVRAELHDASSSPRFSAVTAGILAGNGICLLGTECGTYMILVIRALESSRSFIRLHVDVQGISPPNSARTERTLHISSHSQCTQDYRPLGGNKCPMGREAGHRSKFTLREPLLPRRSSR
jgi:hypothetical protein